jgi:protein O-mannosyl-transferase
VTDLRRLGTRTAVVASSLVALAASAPSLGHDFVYDDAHIVGDREVVREGRIGELLTATYWPEDRGGSLWRPGALAAFRAQWALGAGSPAVFHAVNVLLYVGVAALLALLAAWLFGGWVGLSAGVLFAAHPVHVEATANVVGQAELLPALCYLAVLLLAWRSVASDEARRIPILLGAALLTLVGVSVKEHMVTLPGSLAILWWLAAVRSDTPFRVVARRELPVLMAVLLPLGIYVAGRALLLGDTTDAGGVAGGLDPDSPLQRLGVMLPVSLHWLRLLFWPVELSADYGPAHLFPRPGFGALHAAALGVWLVLAGVTWRFRLRVPPVAVGAALFLVTISIVSNVVVPLEVLLAERLLFLPSAGWAIAVGGLAVHAATAWPGSRTFVAAGVAAASLLLLGRSLERVPTWSDNERFFEQMAEDAPRSYRNFALAGERALEGGDSARAEQAFLEALELNPFNAPLAERLGLMRLQGGRPEAAIPLFIHALEQAPARQASLLGLALSLTRAGRGEEALRWLDWLEELHETGLETTVARIEALRGASRYREAVDSAREALRDHPRAWHLHLLAAESAARGGLCDAALEHVAQGRPVAPDPRRGDFDRIVDAITADDVLCPDP